MAVRFAEEKQGLAPMQSRRDERPSARGEEIASGADGAPTGTSGVRPRISLPVYAAVAAFMVLLLTVSALTVQHDAHGAVAAWQPFVWEYTAAAMILAAMPGVGFLTERTSAAQGQRLRFVLVHLIGSIVFCAVVVGGFVLLRKLIYSALGLRYVFGPLSELIYEYRKIALGYGGMVFVFYWSTRVRSAADPPAETSPIAASPPNFEASFDIRDGSKLFRVSVREILSARSAGNYVEFRLADGSRPLMRSTLSNVEAELGPHGFLRTHRSWIINPTHLRALEPEGSGDWLVILQSGETVPLSRRYLQALDSLRGANTSHNGHGRG